MNPTHLHLMLNHIPVLGIIFGMGLWFFALKRKSEELKKAALGIFIIITLIAIPVYFTGEPAEEGVEDLPEVSDTFIENHEEAAIVAFIGIIILGLTALSGLFLFNKSKVVSAWFIFVISAMSLIVTGLMLRTANLGGQIRHTEIRSGAHQSFGKEEQNHD